MKRLLALLLPALLSAACATTHTTTTTWGEPGGYGPPQRHGRVEWIREHVTRQEGNPAGGAAAGAVVGGLLGYGITGRGGGALVGAIGGGAVGAVASQGSSEQRSYDVAIRFDDGAFAVYRFSDATPFAVGDRVTWSAGRFYRASSAPPPGPPPPPATPPPPPPSATPPPPPPTAPPPS